MPPRVRIDHTLTPLAASIVRHGLRAAGCRIAEGDECDLLWTQGPPIGELRREGAPTGRISHLIGSDALTSKVKLGAAVASARRQALGLGVAVAAHPRTFAMPDQISDLRLAAAYSPTSRWMRRPKTAGTNQRPEMVSAIGGVGGDPRWIVQEFVGGGTAIRVPALVSSLDPLTVDCWARPNTAGDVPADAWATIEMTIAALVATVRDRILNEHAALEVASDRGFELLEFDFLIAESGTVYVLDCAKWPHVRPAGRARDNPRADAMSDAVVRATLHILGMLPADAGRRPEWFHRLIPSSDPQRLALLPSPSPGDIVAARLAAAAAGDAAGGFQPQAVHHYFLDDAIVLFAEGTEQLSMLNQTGSFVWLRTAEGASPAVVAREMVDVFHGEPDAVEQDVWATLAGWIAKGMLARRAPPQTPALEPVNSTGEHKRHGWNAGERVYEHLGRRTCLRSAGGDVEHWIHATLDAYEAPGATTYHDVIEVLPARDGFELLVNGTRTLGPFTPRDTPAAVHYQIRHLPLEAIGCTIAMRGTLVDAGGAAFLLLNTAADPHGTLHGACTAAGLRVRTRDRLLWRGDPLAVVRAEQPREPLALAGFMAIERAIESERSALMPARRADALRQVLVEDADASIMLTPAAAARIVHFVQQIDCLRLLVADEIDAAGCILRACGSLPG